MIRKDQIKILDDKIKANNVQCDLDRMNAYRLILVVIYLNMNI